MKRRKSFACGHRGFGKHCHRCDQEEKQREEASGPSLPPPPSAVAGVSLTHLHPKAAHRAAAKLRRIASGVGYRELGGKRIQRSGMVSIPVGRRYRILCDGGEGRLTPVSVLSHEDYNKAI